MKRTALASALVFSALAGVAGSAYAAPYYMVPSYSAHTSANPAVDDGLRLDRTNGGG